MSTHSSANQHRQQSLIEEYPELPELLQKHINEGVRIKDIPAILLRENNINLSNRSVSRLLQKFDITTTRRSTLDAVDIGTAILDVAEDDPLQRWGARKIKEKLARKGVHVSREFVSDFRREENPEASASCHPTTRKIHQHGLWSTGPNEEWCVDGHEKLISIGIAIWGVIDKFSRLELGLWAVPNARLMEVPPVLMLRLIKETGGMAITTTMDKGSELGRLITMLTSLRHEVLPELLDSDVPTCSPVPSVYNITRERGWAPLWHTELQNIFYEYQTGKVPAGFREQEQLHHDVSLWLWGRVTQLRLDEYRSENATHRVRKQKEKLLPSGGRRIDFYKRPEEYGGKDELIPVPKETVDALLEQYDRPDLLQFGSNEVVRRCEDAYSAIGCPKISAKVAWGIFQRMVEYMVETDEA